MARILVYDGDCPLCWWISQRLVALGVIDGEQRRSFQSFEGARARTLEAAGISNEMLVLEEGSEEIRAGIAGFLWLLENSRWHLLAAPLGIAPLRAMLRFGYRIVAYNRRILAPPRYGIVCGCDPEPHAGFRALFLSGGFLVILGTAAVFGIAVRRAFGIGGVLPAVVLAVALYPVAFLLDRVTSRSTLFRSIGTALVVLVVAGLGALPASVLSLLLGEAAARPLVVVAAGTGAWLGGRSLWRRLLRPGSTGAKSPRRSSG